MSDTQLAAQAGLSGPNTRGERAVDRDREGLDQADQQRGDEGAGQRAEPADHHDDEQDRAEQRRHVRLRHQRGTGDHAGDRGERGAHAEHQHEDAPDIMPEMGDHMRVGERRLHDQADPGLLQHQQQADEDRHRHQQHEHLEGGVVGREQSEGRKVQQRRHPVVDRALAPDDLHQFFDREGQAEGEQEFGNVAVLVDVAQAVALHRDAERAGEQRREDQRRPEPEPAADLEAEEGAEHVEAGMGEVQHAEHAEDHGEAARHQEQQHPEQDAVQRGYDDQFEHGEPVGLRSDFLHLSPLAGRGRPDERSEFGRVRGRLS